MRKNVSKSKGQPKKLAPFKVALPSKVQSQTKRSVQKQLHEKIYGKKVAVSRDRQKSRYSFRQQSANKSSDLKRSNLSKQIKANNINPNKRNDQTTMTEPNDHHLRFQFDSAVKKVFSIIDIFSRGVISEVNINKWVPQAALYFLGSVFQKLRNTTKSLSKQEFQEECVKLFRKSLESDIKEFIDNIKEFQNYNQQKMSIDYENTTNNKQKTVESRVEDRFIFPEDGETSFRNMNFNPQNTMPVRINQEKNIKIQEELGNTDRKQNYENYGRQSENKDSKKIKKNNLVEWNKIKNNLPEPLKDIGQYENVAIQNNFKRAGGLGSCLDMPLKSSQKIHKNIEQRGLKENLIYSHTPKIPESPNFRENIGSSFSKNLEQKKSIGEKRKQSGDKIDELSLRLENFIKQNAARLERSKNARIEL